MTRAEIENRIASLKTAISKNRSKIKDLEKKMKNLESSSGTVSNLIGKIESKVEDNVRTIRKKVDRLNSNSQFRVNYLAAAKKILYGSSTENSVGILREASTETKNKYSDLENELKKIKKKIRTDEQEIATLKAQLEAGNNG